MRGNPSTSRPAADGDGHRLVELTQQAYEATADRYAARWNAVDPVVEAKRHFLDVAGSPTAMVDLGCGTGRDVAWFGDRGLDVVGIGRSAAMLSIGRRPRPQRSSSNQMCASFRSDQGASAWWACA
jgi:SAM-dependent methyltransferase